MPTAAPTDRQLARSRQQSHQDYNQQRYAVRGPDPRSTARWRRLRRMALAEEPLCRDPHGVHAAEGRVEAATDCDHIVGIAQAPALAFERSNIQALCHPCHSIKSTMERQGKAGALPVESI